MISTAQNSLKATLIFPQIQRIDRLAIRHAHGEISSHSGQSTYRVIDLILQHLAEDVNCNWHWEQRPGFVIVEGVVQKDYGAINVVAAQVKQCTLSQITSLL